MLLKFGHGCCAAASKSKEMKACETLIFQSGQNLDKSEDFDGAKNYGQHDNPNSVSQKFKGKTAPKREVLMLSDRIDLLKARFRVFLLLPRSELSAFSRFSVFWFCPTCFHIFAHFRCQFFSLFHTFTCLSFFEHFFHFFGHFFQLFSSILRSFF